MLELVQLDDHARVPVFSVENCVLQRRTNSVRTELHTFWRAISEQLFGYANVAQVNLCLCVECVCVCVWMFEYRVLAGAGAAAILNICKYYVY